MKYYIPYGEARLFLVTDNPEMDSSKKFIVEIYRADKAIKPGRISKKDAENEKLTHVLDLYFDDYQHLCGFVNGMIHMREIANKKRMATEDEADAIIEYFNHGVNKGVYSVNTTNNYPNYVYDGSEKENKND